MNIFHQQKISEKINKETRSLQARGMTEGSYFHCIFSDDSEVNESEYNWSDISEEMIISHMGKMKMVMLSTHPIKTLSAHYGDSSITINTQEGDRVYQAIKSTLSLSSDNQQIAKNVGRVIGLVRNGVMVEEQYLSFDGQIYGIKPS
jgi:hypothetical protein